MRAYPRTSHAVPAFLAVLIFILFAVVDTSANTAKAKNHRVVKDTTDTLVSPGPDGITYDKAGGGHASERKVVVQDKVVTQDNSTTTSGSSSAQGKTHHRNHDKNHKTGAHRRGMARDTIPADSTVILGTPGSPSGAESRGMPGEKPIPGTKK
jgi:hypothetical protein